MGVEYRLAFDYADAARVGELLRRVPGASSSAGVGQVEFRVNASDDGMPDACAQVERWGVYFCVYGSEGRRFLGEVLARLTTAHEPITVTEL